jgi:hypothetical protein
MIDIVLLVLKIGILVLLYLFIWQVVKAAVQNVRGGGGGAAAPAADVVLPAGDRLAPVFTPAERAAKIMPTKKPRGRALTRAQKAANQRIARRRVRIEHVNSRVKRCCIVKDRMRLWKQGIRDLVMELCCALHNFRVRLTPWQPMV